MNLTRTMTRSDPEDIYAALRISKMALPMPDGYRPRWLELIHLMNVSPGRIQFNHWVTPVMMDMIREQADRFGVSNSTLARACLLAGLCAIKTIEELDNQQQVKEAAQTILELGHLLSPNDRRYLREQLSSQQTAQPDHNRDQK